ncbi:glycosyltransferase [Brucella rhizosphaerae]|uniref:glycosyltransferase n=1 Tax=Brucella rhizosphaerae TaxID=571254 RepID=UPI0004669181|nr:glycosyltransferase [Brucella rhizosphaerae]
MTDKSLKRLTPILPTASEWKQLTSSVSIPESDNVRVDIIIPVYRGLVETMRCIYSVLAAPQNTPHRVIVVNDHSPDPELSSRLDVLASEGLIELHYNEKNLGFVGTVNYGMKLHPDRDVLLLNSDTEVYGDWLDRLHRAAYQHERNATVTPLSNNAEICSYPRFVEDNNFELEVEGAFVDKLAAEVNAGCYVHAPTGVGFCLFIKRQCLNEVGYFDVENFGRGYGEENDFCQRASAVGYFNIIAASVFVRHYGSTSFGSEKADLIKNAVLKLTSLHPNYVEDVNEFIRVDPLKKYRERIDLARISGFQRSPLIAMVTHRRGGGTEVHVEQLRQRIREEGGASLVFRPHWSSNIMLYLDDPHFPNIGPFFINDDFRSFARFLSGTKTALLHIHHLVDLAPVAADYVRKACEHAGVEYDFTAHDYFTVCPRINLIDQYGAYCGEPSIDICEKCVKADHQFERAGGLSVWDWRDRYGRLMLGARRVLVPNEDVKRRLSRYMNNITLVVRPHFEDFHREAEAEGILDETSLADNTECKKIVLLGVIGHHKGLALLIEVAEASKQMNLPMKFVVIGYTPNDAELLSLGNVEITGPYDDQDSVKLLRDQNADLVWMASIWPETYSYTLSHVFQAGLHPVAFDFGAIACRIKEVGLGQLLPIELMLKPKELALMLYETEAGKRSEAHLWAPKTYNNIWIDYYGFDEPYG